MTIDSIDDYSLAPCYFETSNPSWNGHHQNPNVKAAVDFPNMSYTRNVYRLGGNRNVEIVKVGGKISSWELDVEAHIDEEGKGGIRLGGKFKFDPERNKPERKDDSSTKQRDSSDRDMSEPKRK